MKHKSTLLTQYRLYYQLTLWQWWIDFKWWVIEWRKGNIPQLNNSIRTLPLDKSNPPQGGSGVIPHSENKAYLNLVNHMSKAIKDSDLFNGTTK